MITSMWRPDVAFLYDGIDPQKVADEIVAIGDSATPEQIVEKAKDSSTELHKCFTWNDTEAAEKWRKYEARKICCNLIIREVFDDNKPPVRYLYKTDAGGYKPSKHIFTDTDEHQKLLAKAHGELKAFKVKYGMLQELDYICSLIQ